MRRLDPWVTLLVLVGFGLDGCQPEDSAEAAKPQPVAGAGEIVKDSDGPLLKTEFNVKLAFGKFVAPVGRGEAVLTVNESGCSLEEVLPGKPPKPLFSGGMEKTFDGIRCQITKVNGKRKEAEAYFEALPDGYEFKTANLLSGVSVPKSFRAK
ncbi:MAG: hypothetical protein SFX74_11120 [Fimbriimonadaceae bacterium]|nr:hypothetical protein [Fimbriimonadaceae bacterium]